MNKVRYVTILQAERTKVIIKLGGQLHTEMVTNSIMTNPFSGSARITD